MTIISNHHPDQHYDLTLNHGISSSPRPTCILHFCYLSFSSHQLLPSPLTCSAVAQHRLTFKQLSLPMSCLISSWSSCSCSFLLLLLTIMSESRHSRSRHCSSGLVPLAGQVISITLIYLAHRVPPTTLDPTPTKMSHHKRYP